MTLRITDDCIECQACLQVCPCQAVSQVRAAEARPPIAIDSSTCTHCWPYHKHPLCTAVCPVDCIVVDPHQPVPPARLIMQELENLMSVVGPFEVARMTVRMRQWIRESFARATWDASRPVDADMVLDFYNFLSLVETEFAPDDGRTVPADIPLIRTGSSV